MRAAHSIVGPYRALLSIPHARGLVLAALIGRLPIGIASLALVLLARDSTGSFATAGAVTAVYAAAGGLAAPVQGRLVDRLGQARVLVPSALLNALGLAATVVFALEEQRTLLYLSAALAGASLPPLSACMRALWGRLLGPGDRLDTAYALESVLVEVFFICGPLLTAAIVTVASPEAAVLTAAVMTLVGTLAFAASSVSRAWHTSERRPGLAGALASPGMRTLVLTVLPSAVAFGTLEVALPAFADQHGGAEAGGILLAALAAGSMVGGLWYGSRRWSQPLHRRYLQLSFAFAAGLALPPLAASMGQMVFLMALAGLALAPIVSCSYGLIDRLAPRGTATEAFTWVITANVAGTAAGAALAGGIVERAGVSEALLLACAGAGLGALVALARRRTLTPAGGEAPAG